MGKHHQARNFLCVRFNERFLTHLPPGKDFDATLLDLMMRLAPLAVGQVRPRFNSSLVARLCAECVAFYQNRECDPSRPTTRTLVVMMDTPQWVPGNKTTTQRSRDGTDGKEDDCEDDDEPRAPQVCSHMDETLYNQLVAERGGDTEALFLDYGAPLLEGLTGAAVWRSPNLKFQLWRHVTLEVLQLPVPELQTLLVDNGIAVSTRRLREVRALLLRDHGWASRPPFERECLVHQALLDAPYHQRLLLYDDRQFKRLPPCRVGEADIKIQAYIQPHNGAWTYLVVNQDTDILFVLLLHMRSFLGGFTESELARVEVWIDTRSPTSKDPPTPYRYIDVKGLYHDLLAFFASEYPDVQHPIETFCLLVFSLHTDFTRPFPGCLRIGLAQVWDTFSELHSVAPEGYVQFTHKLGTPIQRCRTTQYASQLRGLLNHAVQYDVIKERFYLQREPLSRFYYYLCQHGVMRARKSLQLPALAVKTAIRGQELMLYARELQERLDAYCAKRGDMVESLPMETTAEQMFDCPMLGGALSAHEMKSYLVQNEKTLAALTKRPPPPLFGVPTLKQMAARITRIAWYLKYCRHGFQSVQEHTADCVATLGNGQSVWGWREIETSEVNSTYNEARISDNRLHYYATVETDDVPMM